MWRFVLFILSVSSGSAIRLAAYMSSAGLHGEFRFEQQSENFVKIRFALQTTLQYPEQQWQWSITKFPVDYTVIENRCDERRLGETIIDLTELVGPLVMPGNETSTVVVPGLNLVGDKGLWAKGLLLTDVYSPQRICASITALEKNVEKNAEARFYGPIAGSVWFRWLGGQPGDDTTDTIMYADLQHVSKQKLEGVEFTEHNWKIYVTDIFQAGEDQDDCNTLQTVFNPDNRAGGNLIGDLDTRLGKIKVAVDTSKSYKSSYRDTPSSLLPAELLGSYRSLYIIIFHPTHTDSFLACAKITRKKTTIAKTLINSEGIKGEVTLSRETRFDPTWVNVSLSTVNDLETRIRYATKMAAYRIHEMPRDPLAFLRGTGSKDICLTTKNIYNPSNIDLKTIPPPGMGTQDQYAIGDLSGKLQDRKEGSSHNDILAGSAKLTGIYWDVYLPLSGINSVVHRSLVLHKYKETDNKIVPWTCGTLATQLSLNTGQMPMITAQAIFRYPIVGRIIFRQPLDEPEMDTTVIIENLVHADGSALNNTAEHRWMIHDNPTGKDFYNWTGRCLSTGNPYNPHKVEWNSDDPNHCSSDELTLCRMGDLTRHGSLSIAGRKHDGPELTRKLFTDTALPLSGFHSVIGKSLVIYDDHGPVARGERLACSIISRVYRNKAVAKDWFGNGNVTTLTGKFEFIQQSEYDVTDIETTLEGLQGLTSRYDVHMTPIEMDLEFPCEVTTLYDRFNPKNVNVKYAPMPGEGTVDQYAIGDLSGKFGTLDKRKKYSTIFNDTELSLFGPRSILGRSVVIHEKYRDFRWSCSTIERGYAPSEARELRAIASFHHPNGFAYGYIRMTQLIYKDNSQSETIIEVKLRYPGHQDRNITRNHNWAIYVNPVGVDATVQTKDHRCVGAGYMWNPYYTQLADPLNEDLYKRECGPDLPLRCYVGDISARLGPIDLGLERKILVDSNLPLEGKVSAMGKSIVLMEPNFGYRRFACANIEPDFDIVKYANIGRTPRFVTAQFLDEVRQVMGIPEWMLSIDNRKTKTLHNGGCIQFLLHFRGPVASRMEQDFSKLISTGRLLEPSLSIPGYVHTKRKTKLGYRQCGSRDPNDKSSKPSFWNSSPTMHLTSIVTLLPVLCAFM